MQDVSLMKKRGWQDHWKEENVSVSHAGFSSVRGHHLTLKNQIVFHDSACSALHYSIFLVQQLK
jgi:hypothetical protein